MTSSRRRSFAIRTCTAGAALLLATACAGDAGDGEPDEPDSSKTSEPTEEPTEEPTGTGAPRVGGDGYSYAMPDGWEDITALPEVEDADTFVRSATPSAFATNVNTTVRAEPGIDTLTADTPRLAQERNRFEEDLTDHTGVPPRPVEDTELDGSFTIGHTVDGFEAQGTTVTITQYMTVRDNVTYVITLTAAAADAESAGAALTTVMESWAWE